MVSSSFLWTVFALGAAALPAPTFTFSSGAAQPAEKQVISEYFDMLGRKVQAGRKMSHAPVCNLNNAAQPVLSPKPLPGPSTGLTLKHVAIGRGTQNYTCSTNATAAPVALGAVATLFNASCVASTYPDLLSILPNVALQFDLNLAPSAGNLNPVDLMLSGHHYFTNVSTPFFNLNTKNWKLGSGGFAKSDGMSAPAGASIGQNNQGFGAVPWLKLTARDGVTGGLQEVYRVNTAGGNPPTTCADRLGSSFDVQYAAEYWFYEEA
ncbi:hypothetical protein DSL72_008069 [Monilinia vaccinii-corymbosi]|uniref:Malate dehydrogenase n=1 Tax=Monilinia vaccinii-corymbosi TaxID=61207 RepID=A0A8A3PIU5_9HELO|nr:hypothetical protein DSL72_008069 [Monilinia vaccinii-corymbosi]